MSVDVLLDQLTLEEKAALTSGAEFWYTVGVDRLGIRRIMVSDGPHGLRAQPQGGDHIGLGNFPLMSLTTFVGMSPDHDTVMQMAATWAQRHGATT